MALNWFNIFNSFVSKNQNYLNKLDFIVLKQIKGGKMGTVIAKTGVKREKGYLYFLDKKGNVAKVQMKRAGKKTSRTQTVVAKTGIKRKKGYLYYLDGKGNVCEAKMQRGGRRQKRR